MSRRDVVLSRAAGIALGVLADAVLADPRRGHPVAAFGRAVSGLEQVTYGPSRARGAGFTVVAVSGPVALGLAAERMASQGATRRRWVGALVTASSTWVSLGGTSLVREGLLMARALEGDDLTVARQRLTHLCARDPAGLTGPELARATVESMAENTSDAVVAPLFWAAVAGPAGVLGYRAVNTLDAMVGYRSARYQEFGWASARLDDLVNLVPSRLTGLLTVVCAPLVGGSVGETWRIWRRDGDAHPSPNAGQCEASAAGALGVQLGGLNSYGGHVESRPVVGAGGREPQVPDVRRASRLSRVVGWAAAAVAVTALAVVAVVVSAVADLVVADSGVTDLVVSDPMVAAPVAGRPSGGRPHGGRPQGGRPTGGRLSGRRFSGGRLRGRGDRSGAVVHPN